MTVLFDPARRRLLTYTAAPAPETMYARYADPEGHRGPDAADRGRDLAYRRGLAVLSVDLDALLSVSDVVAVHAPTEGAPADPAE